MYFYGVIAIVLKEHPHLVGLSIDIFSKKYIYARMLPLTYQLKKNASISILKLAVKVKLFIQPVRTVHKTCDPQI